MKNSTSTSMDKTVANTAEQTVKIAKKTGLKKIKNGIEDIDSSVQAVDGGVAEQTTIAEGGAQSSAFDGSLRMAKADTATAGAASDSVVASDGMVASTAPTAAVSGGVAGTGISTGAMTLGGLALGGAAVAVGSSGSGGGGGSSSSGSTTSTPTTISGSVTAGPIVSTNALHVAAYMADGTQLGETVNLSSNGTFIITTTTSYRGLVLIKVMPDSDSSADYMDEASGTGKDLDTSLRGIVNVNGGGSYSLAISPLTELAVRELNVSDTTIGSTITQTNVTTMGQAVSNTFGLGNTDIMTQTPVATVNTDGTSNSSSNQYGQVLAALSGADQANSGSMATTITTLAAGLTVSGNTGQLDTTTANMVTTGATTVSATLPSGFNQQPTPTISITSVAGDGYVNSAEKSSGSISIIGTTTNVADGQTVSIMFNGQTPASTATVTNGTWTYTFNPVLFSSSTYTVTADVSNAFGTAASQASHSMIVDAQLPTFSSGSTASVAENIATSTVVYDANAADNDTLTFSLGGADAALFTIDWATGEVRFRSSPDYENPTDTGGDNVYDFNVIATDNAGNTATKTVALSVTNMYEGLTPTITIGSLARDGYIDDSEHQPGADVTISGTTTNVEDGRTVEIRFNGQNPAATATVTNNTWSYTFYPASIPDGTVYTITADVTNSGGVAATQASGTLIVDITGPVFSSSTSASIAENTVASTVVYDANATDSGSNPITYLLSGTDAALFSIDSSTGEVRFNASRDYENPADGGGDNIYDITVTARDLAGNTTSQNVAVTVTDVAEAVSMYTVASVLGSTQTNFKLIDPVTVGGNHYYLLDLDNSGTYTTADDTNHNTLDNIFNQGVDTTSTNADRTATFVLSNGSKIDVRLLTLAELQSINSAGTAAGWSDQTYWAADTSAANQHGWYSFFSTNTGYTTDTVNKVVAVEVLSSETTAPTFTTAASQNIQENTADVFTVVASDNQSATLTYAITGGADASLFTINSLTGVISTVGSSGLDYENPSDSGADNVFDLVVSATDSSGNVATQNLSLTLQDFPETYTLAISGNTVNTIDLGGMKLINRIDYGGNTWFYLDVDGDGSLTTADTKDHQWLDQLITGNSAVDTTNAANNQFSVTTTTGSTINLKLVVSDSTAATGEFMDYLATQNSSYFAWTASLAGGADQHYSVSHTGATISADSSPYYVAFQVV